MLEDSVAFKNVIANGLVLDKNGNKMSKRLGNAVDPFETISQIRPRCHPLVHDCQRPALGQPQVRRRPALRRCSAAFSAPCSTLIPSSPSMPTSTTSSPWVPGRPCPQAERSELDRWILSKLQSLLGRSARPLRQLTTPPKPPAPSRTSLPTSSANWYVRLSRRRFWKGELTTRQKRAAYETLHECLLHRGAAYGPRRAVFCRLALRQSGGPAGVPRKVKSEELRGA